MQAAQLNLYILYVNVILFILFYFDGGDITVLMGVSPASSLY